ncbi:MAG TPA: 1-deoxy-D-xylulose-5-phosphate reductoisomerase [Tepidisphaeraceae bacterium]|nr:1-deoxy-D-xylulose-5-phosphate reductoisomerase [Tepidisphaeraceae bacterium]
MIRAHPDRLHLVGLSAHQNVELLAAQCAEFGPTAVAIADHAGARALRDRFAGQIHVGTEGLTALACRDDVDVVLAAIVGSAGLPAVLAAIRAGKQLALANKECLVVAGEILMREAAARGVVILPVDSEHSAVFQAMKSGRRDEVRRVILTASGGPFRNWSAEQMSRATVADALNHPTWSMGKKISIDSATMFNKALEIIEAVWLFDLPPERVEVVIHPESVVHSMVEFVDGSVIAQLSPPDMRTPIQYSLCYPDRIPGSAPKLDINRAFGLTFAPPDPQRFPALRLAYEVARQRGTMGAVLNAANEEAVAGFTTGKIAFGQIASLVETIMQRHRVQPNPSLDDLMEADRWARTQVGELIC